MTWSRPWGVRDLIEPGVAYLSAELDVVVDGFLGRTKTAKPTLTCGWTYGRIVNVSVVVATAVIWDGRGYQEDGAFWLPRFRQGPQPG